ncbi:MAG: hypothetical protein SGPRY_008045 [Prymnesium sp.]
MAASRLHSLYASKKGVHAASRWRGHACERSREEEAAAAGAEEEEEGEEEGGEGGEGEVFASGEGEGGDAFDVVAEGRCAFTAKPSDR